MIDFKLVLAGQWKGVAGDTSKGNLSYMCVSRDKKCSIFRKIWPAFFSCYLNFEIRLFALLPTTSVGALQNCYSAYPSTINQHKPILDQC